VSTAPNTKNLSLALRLVGLIFIVGIYPLTIIWPSGWSWVPAQPMYLQMILGIYVTLGIFLFLAAKDPMKHLSLIWFAVWSSFVHAGIMAYQALTTAGNSGHIMGDVAALAIVGALLAVLTPKQSAAA
jgi:hypothetical protein